MHGCRLTFRTEVCCALGRGSRWSARISVRISVCRAQLPCCSAGSPSAGRRTCLFLTSRWSFSNRPTVSLCFVFYAVNCHWCKQVGINWLLVHGRMRKKQPAKQRKTEDTPVVQEFVVETIIRRRIFNGRVEYFLKWKGFTE